MQHWNPASCRRHSSVSRVLVVRGWARRCFNCIPENNCKNRQAQEAQGLAGSISGSTGCKDTDSFSVMHEVFRIYCLVAPNREPWVIYENLAVA